MNSDLPPLDLTRLSDLLLTRLNNEGKVQLSHHDMRFEFRRDSNYSGARFGIKVFVFNEEFSDSYFSPDCTTPEKIIDILFLHMRDDYGHSDVRLGLIAVKTRSLETRLYATFPRVRKFLKAIFTEEDGLHADIYVEELYPYDNVDTIGLPFFHLLIVLPDSRTFSIPLDSARTNIHLGQQVLEQVAKLTP